MRELTTIGSLRNMRAMRTVERNSRLVVLRGMGWMGATDTSYAAPSAATVDASPPGGALTAATLAMLEHFQTAGVPSMHSSDAFVLAFQQAYNKDPAPWAGSAHKLSEDGGYGPNTHDAVSAIVDVTGGGPVPSVNTGSAPAAPSVVVLTKPSTSTTTTTTTTKTVGLSSGAKWTIGLLVALAAGWGVSRVLKKRRARRRGTARTSTAIVLA